MELHFTGRGSAFNPAEGNSNAYLIRGNRLFLLDIGEGTFERLKKVLPLEEFESIDLFLTHLHCDHVGSIGSLISYEYCLFQKKITVHHPEKTVLDLLDLLGIKRDMYLVDHAKEGVVHGLNYRFIETVHVDNMVCYGVALSAEGDSLYFSGDAADIPEEILQGMKEGTIGRLYQDTTLKNPEKPGHLYLGKLLQRVPEELRRKVICMHLDEGAEEKIKGYGLKIVELEEPWRH